MDAIQEIIYLPSLRCNLNCKHCGENQNVKEKDELNSIYVLEQICSSLYFKGNTITISGGEPFLNKTFSDFLVNGVNNTSFLFSITSNGYFTDRIKKTIEQIDNKEQISFQISIDGMEKTHNEIRRNKKSFKKAVSTVKYLIDAGVNVSINTVVQMENLNELEEMKDFFGQISNKIEISFIPISIDIGENKKYEYTKEYQEKVWKYVDSNLDKKKILSKGKYGVSVCHAGRKNLVIGPDGKVYVCLTGTYYKNEKNAEKFCLGDLSKGTLDEILINTEKREQVYKKAVKDCKGCTNPCEVNREVFLFGQTIGITENELRDFFAFDDNTQKFGSGFLDYGSWHEIEHYGEDSLLCWSNQIISKMFIPLVGEEEYLSISYRKLTDDTSVKIIIDGRERYRSSKLEESIDFNITCCRGEYVVVIFAIDKLVRPCDVFESEDIRYLGIGLQSVSLR